MSRAYPYVLYVYVNLYWNIGIRRATQRKCMRRFSADALKMWFLHILKSFWAKQKFARFSWDKNNSFFVHKAILDCAKMTRLMDVLRNVTSFWVCVYLFRFFYSLSVYICKVLVSIVYSHTIHGQWGIT